MKAGEWVYTGNVDDLVDLDGNGNPVRRSGNYGFYAIIDQMLFREKEERGVGLFVQF